MVPKTIKGSHFSHKVSPGHSRIYLGEEVYDRPHMNELNFSFYNKPEDFASKEQLGNISLIENRNGNEDDTEEFFLFTPDRATPVMMNLDEIVEAEYEKREKTSSKMYEYEQSSPDKDADDFRVLNKNGRWFRKSSDTIGLKALKPKEPKPPASEPVFVRKVRKSKSSKDLNNGQLLNLEDYKKLDIKKLGNRVQNSVKKNRKYEDWMD